MKIGSQKLKLRDNFHHLLAAIGLLCILWITSMGTLSAQTSIEDEVIDTLQELAIDFNTLADQPIPEVYKTPPIILEQTVGGTTEWKLFYYCKYHTSDNLKTIIHEQFATKLFDKDGKETQLPDYNVTSNPATNQLIVRCPAREDAEAVLETLRQTDVPPIQVKIDCLISEIYADFTYDRETTIAIENLFGENITLKPGGTAFGDDVQQLIADDEYLPAFPGASLRELFRSRMGLKIGYSSTGHQFTALIDMLESRGYLKILMNPTIETVNGKTALVRATQNIPLQTITKTVPGVGNTTVVQTETEYVDVIDSLEITPYVFADGQIGLETNIILGLGSTPLGVKQVPIVTKKEISNKENRIRSGESLIIGGMRKTENFGVTRGVPILRQIPLIGFLFSGEDTEERAVETIFVLTPVISTNGNPQEEVMAEIENRHATDSTPASLVEVLSDPFGTSTRKTLEGISTSETQTQNTQISGNASNAEYQANPADTDNHTRSEVDTLAFSEQSNDTSQEQDLNKTPEESIPQDVMIPWRIEKVKADGLDNENKA